ncbi:hypothetical protein, partial [Paenibacillus xylanexedens]|uniref:hypothetical protein n=1 Tax=Paenibacillus xylanexedens TaxID=528191 RepID=UPI0011A3BEBB
MGEQNMIEGVSETGLEGGGPIRGGELRAVMVGLMGVEMWGKDEDGFEDVRDEDWFGGEMKGGVHDEMVEGMGNGKSG